MTPEELCEAVDILVDAVSAEPVLVEVDGLLYELEAVEADTAGQLILRTKGQGL